jgi:hypothetical protein
MAVLIPNSAKFTRFVRFLNAKEETAAEINTPSH